ncbi:hypothetical protein [Dictyobacter kobayashii]|uniref:Uncharacterized protein n=1 Tax=Dictyobacter kobayashii TaxID=2014872 RepID=A0A402AEX8_9CHLR|nr:hypothetical protein [Dictyobacter kobayashii]GCE17677.1 hypothetical protein KDK_14770 [Dictyobacter kobayashii]
MNTEKILLQVYQNAIPNSWEVFRGKKHDINDLPNVSDNDIPILVITPEGWVEYINAYLSINSFSFADYKEIYLRVVEKDFGDDNTWTLIDLRLILPDKTQRFWSPQPNFEDKEILIFQRVIEAFARYSLLHNNSNLNVTIQDV